MPSLHQIKTFLSYWVANVTEHSLHSPFFYDFYTRVVKPKPQLHEPAERLRKKLEKSSLSVHVEELGSGSVLNSPQRKVSDIARVSLSTSRYSALYARAIDYYHCNKVVELGTSLGINSLYLSQNCKTELVTFEGSTAIAELALDTFRFAQRKNIRLIQGNLDATLEEYLQYTGTIDFAFLDANHRYTPTIRYFNMLLEASHHQSVIVLDDIHLNEEMEKAWKEIKEHDLVYGTADLYRCGFVFLDPSLHRQHYVLQF